VRISLRRAVAKKEAHGSDGIDAKREGVAAARSEASGGASCIARRRQRTKRDEEGG